jgi:hypothetical protein
MPRDRLHLNLTQLSWLGLPRARLRCSYTYTGPGEAEHVFSADAVTWPVVLRPQGYEDSLYARCS